MNDENWYQSADDPDHLASGQSYPPKAGMSTAAKVLIGLGIFAGIMLLLCCGGIYFFGSKLAEMGTEDPVRIQQIREEIAGIALPEEWEPDVGIDGGFFGFVMRMVLYHRGADGGNAVFALMQFTMPGQEGAEEVDGQMQIQFRQNLQQQGYSTEFNVKSSEERVLTVNGVETEFDFITGTTPAGAEVRQVTGTFPGRGGPTMLLYQVPEEDWDEDQVVGMIESIEN